MEKEMMNKLLDLGADEAVVKITDDDIEQVRFSRNRIDIAKNWLEKTADIFVAVGNKTFSTTLKNFEDVDKSLKKVMTLVKKTGENKSYHGTAKDGFDYRKPSFDKKIIGADCKEYVHDALNEIEGTGAGTVYKHHVKTRIATPCTRAKDETTSIEFSIRVFLEDLVSGHRVNVARDLSNFDPASAAREASALAKMYRNPKGGTVGQYDLILDPLFFGSMVNYTLGSASAFNVEAGMSFFKDKIGEKVAPEFFTMIDTGEGLYARRFDDEGASTGENKIIENGVYKTYLHNTSTAHRFETETTGNAGLVAPGSWNFEIEPGNRSKEELFEDFTGLYLTNTWYTRFQNRMTGDFSTIPRDAIFYYENGEIRESWKDIRVSDNMLNLYKNIAALSRERQMVKWWYEVEEPGIAPYVLVKDVNITQSTQ
ncbi:MAG: TldD/PmbA family protein [Euryarchaeota archaeon]|nr:TldD/PmbA family protein [Euryarchaeota archaeon]